VIASVIDRVQGDLQLSKQTVLTKKKRITINKTSFYHSTARASMDGDAQYMDELDYYNYGREFDRMSKVSGGHAKHKGKKENLKFAPSGNVRKIVANVQNAEKKEKQARQRVNSV
jgi:hypothetical protein